MVNKLFSNLSMIDLSVKFMEQKFIRISRVETIRLGLAKYIKYTYTCLHDLVQNLKSKIS